MQQQGGTFTQFIIEYLPRISADPKIGEAIIMNDQSTGAWNPNVVTIRYEKCPVGRLRCPNYNMCRWHRKYNAQLCFKHIRYTLSNAFLDYLQVCIIYF